VCGASCVVTHWSSQGGVRLLVEHMRCVAGAEVGGCSLAEARLALSVLTAAANHKKSVALVDDIRL
jgi:hypothetical protein